jgi:hypothetical protein
MTVVTFNTPAFARRNRDMICWRVSAIYRCCLRLGKSKTWALEKLREISPEGKRDHMADIWFANIEEVRRYHFSCTEAQEDMPEMAQAA